MFDKLKNALEIIEQNKLQNDLLQKQQQSILQRIEIIEKQLSITPTPSADTPTTAREQNDHPIPVIISQPVDDPPVLEAAPSKTISTKEDLEFKIGGTWLNRLGAGAVILGLVFFLKYSFDNQLIGPTGRIILGIISGLIMLGVGEKLRAKFSGYSQGLIGAGSLALYISTYTAYDFYHLISPGFAFVFLIFIMANTVLTAVRHDALTIGILGIIGGYLAPLMISTGTPLPWVFFGYLTILTCGILGVSIYKRWNSFRLISFAFNQLLITIWYFTSYSPKFLVPSFIFVSFNFIAYLVIATGYNTKTKSLVNSAETMLIFLNATTFFLWSHLFLKATLLKDYMGFYALAIALAYIYIGRLAYQVHKEDKKQVYTLFAVAIKLITLAIYLQLDHKYLAYGWMLESFGIFYLVSMLQNRFLLGAGLLILLLANLALPTWSTNKNYLAFAWLGEALGLFLMGYRLKIPEVRVAGTAALCLGGMIALETAMGWQLNRSKIFLFNLTTYALMLTIVITGIMYYLYKQLELELLELRLRRGLGIAALLLIFAFLTLENHHFFRLYRFKFFLSPEQLSLSLIWMIYAIVLFVAGLKRNIKELRYGALGLIAVIIAKAFLVDLAGLATIFKILLFVILGLFLLGISFLYQKKQNMFNRSEAP